MANPQLGHHQGNEEELECLRQSQSQRAQPLSRRYLWSETDKVETSDSRVGTPVADSDNHRKIQHRPRKAYVRDDMSICRLPEQAVNSKYDIPPRRCRERSPAPVPPSKCANDSPSMAPKPLAKDTAESDSLPNPPSGSESTMMQQPETRPISQEQLVAEVEGIYAGLVMVETNCIEFERAASAISDFESAWEQAFFELHSIRYPESLDDFIVHLNTSSVETSQYHDLEALLSEVSLRSRSFCRLNSRLLPLLQARKGTPSSARFVEFMTLTKALSDILSKYSSLLDFTDTILSGLFDLITSIIRRLNLRFRSAYEELKCRNRPTQIIFEFPNNMRHVCTTMPWTILSALLVLWGVCWMFIIGPGDLEPEKFKAPAPTFSPAPAAYDFLENSGAAYYELGLPSVLMPEPSSTGFDQHPTIDSLLFTDDGAGIDPIYLVQHAPQDPDFLSFDVLPRNSAGIVETSAKEDLTRELPAAVTPDPILQTYGDANRQDPFNQMVNIALVGQVVQNTSDQKSISYFACPKCQQRFANSFTLNRHQTEAHKDAASSPEESFPCPNRGCKRSAKGSPFKRLYNLNRHLQVCKHNPNVVTSSAESDVTEERPLSHSISTPALPDALQPAEPPSEGSSGDSSVRKRSRPEKDNDWSEESLLREMKKKLKRMAQEVKEKEDAYLQAREGLESIQKTIQVMEDSLRKS
ncbi:uncharacterized protein FPRO_12245 [Fusarium proliferatum ET1]|uniref:C2H2-type domain-containing protein n=1 Tax=Fusarium proliferatum (strain ET1) TaxID=1227346 RepID=A0A1L7W2B2_FUSPR|nr:uncharacterized protein FPRO_12245 [Fusarium proliferatum ET1]CZR46794.1 uncharacterized protein FPRO_12245 [Fusarium proliferatum ET1]